MVFFGDSLVRVSGDEQVQAAPSVTVGRHGNDEHTFRDVFGDAEVNALIAANENARG
jgi:hypothetical protein